MSTDQGVSSRGQPVRVEARKAEAARKAQPPVGTGGGTGGETGGETAQSKKSKGALLRASDLDVLFIQKIE